MKDTWKAESKKYINRNRWTGPFHIVNIHTDESLESYMRETVAEYFCRAANEHEIDNGRRPVYAVEFMEGDYQ